jgi:hypothetical protein
MSTGYLHLLFDGVGLDALNKREEVTTEKLEEWDCRGTLDKGNTGYMEKRKAWTGQTLKFSFPNSDQNIIRAIKS